MSNHNKEQAKKPQGQPEEVANAFPDEIRHLSTISEKLTKAAQEADDVVAQQDQSYLDTKQYMMEYRSEIDPREMFQTERLLQQVDRSGAFAVQVRDKLRRLLDSPYFARIDFQEHAGPQAAQFYIGRFAFHHENQMLIVDWRSPVASMFYDYELGPAGYQAPAGEITGELTCKRQFKIKDGKMEYALESSVNIQDDVLQRELSHTSDEKMKSIIATIQKEQNRIIRNEQADTMIIQGVAGSGKTSIALHRIAYLLYRYKDKLTARNITIISPNKVFGDYISNVLPELGEEPIFETSFADIAWIQLAGVIGFEPERDPLECDDPEWHARNCWKSTREFLHSLDDYLARLPAAVFVPRDYASGGFTVRSAWLEDRFQAYCKYPVKRRLQMMADDMLDYLRTINVANAPLPRPKAILKSLSSMLKHQSTLAIYQGFYQEQGRADLFKLAGKQTLEWSDVYPFLYVHAAFEGLQEGKIIRHVLIDEMQDYTPVQYAVMNKLFSCSKTILGDFGQFINPYHTHTLADLQALYPEAELVELYRSYRSTYEVIQFAKRIHNVAKLEAVERHGVVPDLIHCLDEASEIQAIKDVMRRFGEHENVALGIILKTNSEAQLLYNQLSPEFDLHLLTPESTEFKNGITITSVAMAKGLEFDEVLIPYANVEHYADDHDRNLLYIAVTRAMHRLTLTYTEELTQLIDHAAGDFGGQACVPSWRLAGLHT